MKPSSRQLIESIQWELDTRVAPEVSSDWGRSALRSIGALLEHLAVRVEIEAELLLADNEDIRSLFAGLREPPDDLPPTPAVPSIAALTQENEALRAEVDRILRQLLVDGPAESRAAVAAYLVRQLDRERPLVDPAFKRPVF